MQIDPTTLVLHVIFALNKNAPIILFQVFFKIIALFIRSFRDNYEITLCYHKYVYTLMIEKKSFNKLNRLQNCTLIHYKELFGDT